MSLNAGGGNLGMIFSTLTYSVIMAVWWGMRWRIEGCFGGGVAGWKQNFLRSYGKGPR
jgi:hypothetical protein